MFGQEFACGSALGLALGCVHGSVQALGCELEAALGAESEAALGPELEAASGAAPNYCC